jgi:pyrroloquinoline quinone biosynthesis protein B
LQITPFAVPGTVALFLEGNTVNVEELGDQTVGLMLEGGGRRAAYIPGCATVPEWLLARLEDIDLLLFDGTVWNNDEMAQTGTGQKTGARMGHVPLNGDHGSLARFNGFKARKIFIHINNTNPILQPDAPERVEVLAQGWEIAADGMEIDL